MLGNIRVELQDGNRTENEVVEVEGIRPLKARLVLAVRLGEGLLHVVHSLRRGGLVVDEFVLEVRDLREEGSRCVALRVEVEITKHHAHESQGVGLIVDSEAARDPEAR